MEHGKRAIGKERAKNSQMSSKSTTTCSYSALPRAPYRPRNVQKSFFCARKGLQGQGVIALPRLRRSRYGLVVTRLYRVSGLSALLPAAPLAAPGG